MPELAAAQAHPPQSAAPCCHVMLITKSRFWRAKCQPSLSFSQGRDYLSRAYFGRNAVRAMTTKTCVPYISVLLLALTASAANAETRIGSATSVQPDASGSVGGTISVGSGVHANETVKTGSSGQAGLRFNDQSNLSVGHSSQVRLDKFVYDPNKGTGSTVIEATRGTFRFSTGAQNQGEVKIKTPYGTLGTRG
jgi:hypothetical protein